MDQQFYNHTSMETGLFDKKFQILKKLITPDAEVIDLGCYDGRVGTFLNTQLGCQVDGADISDMQIAKESKLREKFIFDLNEKTWPVKKVYDFVLFTDVIEHINDTDQFMLNVAGLVKPGGYIIFSTPNLASLGRRILLLLGKNPYIEVSRHREINLFDAPVVGHIRYFTLPTMKKLAEYHGFQVSDVVPSLFTSGLSIKLIEKFFPGLCWHIFIKAQKRA